LPTAAQGTVDLHFGNGLRYLRLDEFILARKAIDP
jgi:hypothetical protein